MSKPDAWMPLYIADYLADTQHLTRDEHGAYLLLLMAYWRNGGPLQDDDKRLASIVKATAREWASLRATLAEFFAVEGGLWIHKRVDEERAKAAKFIDKQKANGNKGGRPRKTQTITQKEPMGFAWDNPNHNPNESPSPSQLNPSPELFAQDSVITPAVISESLENQTPSRKESTVPPDLDPQFDQAWEAYPKRPGASRSAALKAWRARIRAGVDPVVVLDGVRRYAAYCAAKQTAPEYIKHAATFFGPDQHYLADWTPWTQPRAGPSDREAGRLAAANSIFKDEHIEKAKQDERTIDTECTRVE